jgi:hypothetical protein
MCLLEFILTEESATFMKHFKGRASSSSELVKYTPSLFLKLILHSVPFASYFITDQALWNMKTISYKATNIPSIHPMALQPKSDLTLLL